MTQNRAQRHGNPAASGRSPVRCIQSIHVTFAGVATGGSNWRVNRISSPTDAFISGLPETYHPWLAGNTQRGARSLITGENNLRNTCD
jgi:hypothetical protein